MRATRLTRHRISAALCGLCALALWSTTPVAGQQPAPQTVTVCVVQKGQLREVQAQFDSARGDTTVNGVPFARAYPATREYAARESWYGEHEEILLNGRPFAPISLPEVRQARNLAPLGEYEGVPLFKFARDTGRVDVFFVPVQPGCVFQGYVLSYPEVLPRADLPSFYSFPSWPPPRPTGQLGITELMIPRDGVLPTFQQIADRLEVAFTRAGYSRPTYYAVPGGFGIVTSAEQFRDGGAPVRVNRFQNDSVRFDEDEVETSGLIRSVKDIARQIAGGPRGHFRVIAVVVTRFPLTGATRSLTRAEQEWWEFYRGVRVPKQVAQLRLQPADAVTVIVYEFDRAVDNGPLTFRTAPRASVEAHLRASDIWWELARP